MDYQNGKRTRPPQRSAAFGNPRNQKQKPVWMNLPARENSYAGDQALTTNGHLGRASSSQKDSVGMAPVLALMHGRWLRPPQLFNGRFGPFGLLGTSP